MNEIEDAMTARVHARNKVGPRHWTLRWNAGGEQAKISLSLEFGEVGHLTFAHEAMEKLGIHAVDAENDQTMVAVGIGLGEMAGGQNCCPRDK